MRLPGAEVYLADVMVPSAAMVRLKVPAGLADAAVRLHWGASAQSWAVKVWLEKVPAGSFQYQPGRCGGGWEWEWEWQQVREVAGGWHWGSRVRWGQGQKVGASLAPCHHNRPPVEAALHERL